MGKDSQMFSFDVEEQVVAEAGKRKRKYAIINGIEELILGITAEGCTLITSTLSRFCLVADMRK